MALISGSTTWVLSFNLPQYYLKPNTSTFIKVHLMLLPNITLKNGITTISSLESIGKGLQFSTLFIRREDNNIFSLAFILFIFIFDYFLYGFIAWYLLHYITTFATLHYLLHYLLHATITWYLLHGLCNTRKLRNYKTIAFFVEKMYKSNCY